LFAEVAPRFLDCQGGYTRALRLSPRVGDGAPQALLELTRLPVESPKALPKTKAIQAQRPPAQASPKEAPKKPKRFFEGLRELFRLNKQGAPKP